MKNISSIAANSCVTYFTAAEYLAARGEIDSDDIRLHVAKFLNGKMIPRVGVDRIKQEINAVQSILTPAMADAKSLSRLKTITGTQKRLLCSDGGRLADHMVTAYLGSSLEECYLLAVQNGNQISRTDRNRLLALIDLTTDRSVMTVRHANWNGLVSDIAHQNGQRVLAAGHDLRRNRLLPADDFRATMSSYPPEVDYDAQTPAFLKQASTTITQFYPFLQQIDDPLFTKSTISRDISEMRTLVEAQPKNATAKATRQIETMRKIAHIMERTAVNFDRTGQFPKAKAGLMAMSCSAVSRQRIFEQRSVMLRRTQDLKTDHTNNLIE